MAREFYIAASTAVAKRVYESLKANASDLGRVSVIGGWAVFELVEPQVAMESRDVDILIHDDQAWVPTISHITRQDFAWSKRGRMRDRRLVLRGSERDEDAPAVDVFYTSAVDHGRLQRLFGMGWVDNMKDLPYSGFVPTVEVMVADKLATLPRRPASDPKRKRLKDALDVHALLFHNRQGIPAETILKRVRAPEAVVPALRQLEDVAPFEAEVGELAGALERTQPGR